MQNLFARTALVAPDTPPPTFPSWAPKRAIDHILVSHTLEVEDLRTLPHLVSDHLPITATLKLPPSIVLG